MKKLFGLWVFGVFLTANLLQAQNLCDQAVSTKQGPVLGKQDQKSLVCVYKGIPYALPPVNDLRWRAPQAPSLRSEVLNAFEFGPSCIQNEGITSGGKSKSFSEDCLTLNIFRPAEPGTYPVMFWIHGGAYTQGAGSYEMYNGASLASAKKVVVVTINYRLDFFGFLALPELTKEDPNQSSGNYGVLDQIAALQWVTDNIAGFGGDPGNVTIFGESAGGLSVCNLLAAPPAKGLFHRAIIESGGCDLIQSMEKGYQQGASLVKVMGCEGNDPLNCLRARPGKDLLVTNKDLISGASAHLDNYVLAEQPIDALKKGEFNRVPIMVGSNRDEFSIIIFLAPGGMFASRKQVIKLLENQLGPRAQEVLKMYSFDDYQRPALLMSAAYADGFGSRAFAAAEAMSPFTPVYLYRFDWHGERLEKTLGAFHGLEIPFVFGTLEAKKATLHLLLSSKAVASGKPLSEKMMSYWTNFAKTGDPNAAGLEKWRVYKIDRRERIYFDNQVSVAPLSPEEIGRYQYFAAVSYEELMGNQGQAGEK